jgi:hypothetical protein
LPTTILCNNYDVNFSVFTDVTFYSISNQIIQFNIAWISAINFNSHEKINIIIKSDDLKEKYIKCNTLQNAIISYDQRFVLKCDFISHCIFKPCTTYNIVFSDSVKNIDSCVFDTDVYININNNNIKIKNSRFNNAFGVYSNGCTTLSIYDSHIKCLSLNRKITVFKNIMTHIEKLDKEYFQGEIVTIATVNNINNEPTYVL